VFNFTEAEDGYEQPPAPGWLLRPGWLIMSYRWDSEGLYSMYCAVERGMRDEDERTVMSPIPCSMTAV